MIRNPFGDAGDARFMARNPLEEDSMSLRTLLSTRPEFMDISRMSDRQVRAHVAELRSMDRLPAQHERAPHRARPNVQSEPEPVALAVAAMTAAVVEENRYLLPVALTYHPAQTVRTNKVPKARCKLENELSGPETRGSGKMKTSDPVFSDLRRREMRQGSYRLEFQNAALAESKIKKTRK